MASNESAIGLGVAPEPSGWLRKILKGLLILMAVLIVGSVVAHLVWRSSGSGMWELTIDKNGVQVYTMKEPGSTIEKFKGLRRMSSNLNRAVAAMMDSSLENCRDWIDICASSVAVEPWNPQGLYYIQLYQENFPSPFGPREFLLKTQFSQDPQTKTVHAEFIAVPDRLPPHSCCERIEHMHNHWQFTPVSKDELDVQLVQDMDAKIPYFLYNQESAEGIYDTLVELPKFLNADKYKDAQWDFIQSP